MAGRRRLACARDLLSGAVAWLVGRGGGDSVWAGVHRQVPRLAGLTARSSAPRGAPTRGRRRRAGSKARRATTVQAEQAVGDSTVTGRRSFCAKWRWRSALLPNWRDVSARHAISRISDEFFSWFLICARKTSKRQIVEGIFSYNFGIGHLSWFGLFLGLLASECGVNFLKTEKFS